MNRVRSMWASGLRGKVTIGCTGVAAVALLCLCSAIAWTQSPSGQQAAATGFANQTATSRAAEIAPTSQPIAQAQPTTVPPTIPPAPKSTDVPPTVAPSPNTPAPPTVTTIPSTATSIPPTVNVQATVEAAIKATQAAQPPTNTPVPPTATEPPPPPATATPRPSPNTPPPARARLNGNQIETTFRNLNYSFEQGSQVRGQPRRMGQSTNKLGLIEMIGDMRDLNTASMFIGIPNDNPTAVQTNALQMALFLRTALPDWEGGTDWMLASIQAFVQRGQAETENHYNGRTIKMSNLVSSIGMISMTIE